MNAFAHRSYENRRQTIYLAIYDDRVEIKNPGKFPPNFDLTRLYSPPIQHSEPRNEKIAHVLYLRKSIETWGRGLTRIADECNRVGLPVPEVKEEYGCVTTVFKRPDWTGGNTPDRRTGTPTTRTGTDTVGTGTTHKLSGTGWMITGTTGTAGVEDILARLPKLRKDARANVESVLHEIIADRNATIPQICARTGMALRTINNALATLRGAGVIKTRSNDNQGTGTAQTTTPEHAVTTLETTPETTETTPETSEDRIFWAIKMSPTITVSELANMTGLSIDGVKWNLRKLKSLGKLRRVGHTKGGHWEVLK